KTHPNQVVQIYAEGVSTLDFWADIQKLMDIGYAAAGRWLEMVDRGRTYYPEYDGSDSKEEQALFRSSPQQYYELKLENQFVALYRAIDLDEPNHVKDNIKIRFAAYRIVTLVEEAQKNGSVNAEVMLQKAMHAASGILDKEKVQK